MLVGCKESTRSGNCRAVATLRLNGTRKGHGYGNLGGLSPVKKATSRRMQPAWGHPTGRKLGDKYPKLILSPHSGLCWGSHWPNPTRSQRVGLIGQPCSVRVEWGRVEADLERTLLSCTLLLGLLWVYSCQQMKACTRKTFLKHTSEDASEARGAAVGHFLFFFLFFWK